MLHAGPSRTSSSYFVSSSFPPTAAAAVHFTRFSRHNTIFADVCNNTAARAACVRRTSFVDGKNFSADSCASERKNSVKAKYNNNNICCVRGQSRTVGSFACTRIPRGAARSTESLR